MPVDNRVTVELAHVRLIELFSVYQSRVTLDAAHFYSQFEEAATVIGELGTDCSVNFQIVDRDCGSSVRDTIRSCPACGHIVAGTFCETCQGFLVHLGDTV